MAYKISTECISCGACEAECPVQAISAGDGKYEIDAATCISCGACAGVCPVSAPAEEYAPPHQAIEKTGPRLARPCFFFGSSGRKFPPARCKERFCTAKLFSLRKKRTA